MSDSLWPHGLYLCPWNSPGKNTRVGSHYILQGTFLTQESNPSVLSCRQILYHLSRQGSPNFTAVLVKFKKHLCTHAKLQLSSGCIILMCFFKNATSHVYPGRGWGCQSLKYTNFSEKWPGPLLAGGKFPKGDRHMSRNTDKNHPFLQDLPHTYPLYDHQNALDSLELQGEALCQQVRVAEANIYVALPHARYCSNCLIHLLSFFAIYLFFAVLGLHCWTWAFPSCTEQGFSLVAVHRLLIAMASLIAEHGI